MNERMQQTINTIGMSEGWLISLDFRTPTGEYQIQKDDEQNKFKSDTDAQEFVKSLSAMGSYIHKKAIEFVDHNSIGKEEYSQYNYLISKI